MTLSLACILPKAELHVHLEGTMTPRFVLDLACRNGHPLARQGMDAISPLYEHADFQHFLKHFKILIGVLKSPADLYELVSHYTEIARENNIVYAEVHLTPVPLLSDSMPYPLMMQAVQRGVADAADRGVELRIILDTVRQFGPEHFDETLRLHQAHPCPSVIGIGMGGDEEAAPPELFEEQFSRARQTGLHTVVHSGESGSAWSIWRTLEVLRPKRILHGIRAVDDARLLHHLAEEGIPLDVCPTSNVKTGVVPRIEEHPIRKLFDAGVHVTVNTDDPAMFRTDLISEYRLLSEQFGFTDEEICQTARNAFEASFLPDDLKPFYLQAQQMVSDAYREGKL